MKTFSDLRDINVNKHVEKKGNLSYLSWAWAVDVLMQQDPTATWEFKEPVFFGTTVMVFCEVTALGKTLKMHLPVMDNFNKAVSNPDSRKISDAMMRCLTKCIACFGVGLYIYAGEDLPDGEDAPSADVINPTKSKIVAPPVTKYDPKIDKSGVPQFDDFNPKASITPRDAMGKAINDQAKRLSWDAPTLVKFIKDNFQKAGNELNDTEMRMLIETLARIEKK